MVETKGKSVAYIIYPEEYANFLYNRTIINERAVEVAIAKKWMDDHPNNVIEIGAVMPYYYNVKHPVVDFQDPKATINKYLHEVDITGKHVLSVSTIEHIGCGDYGNEHIDPTGAENALQHILDNSLSCLVTLPIGNNPNLDIWLKANLDKLDCFGYHRTQLNPPYWEFEEPPKHLEYKYNSPFNNANFVLFVTGWKNSQKSA